MRWVVVVASRRPSRACPTAPAACPGETWQDSPSGRVASAGAGGGGPGSGLAGGGGGGGGGGCRFRLGGEGRVMTVEEHSGAGRAALLLADISGYTAFLQAVAAAHAA